MEMEELVAYIGMTRVWQRRRVDRMLISLYMIQI